MPSHSHTAGNPWWTIILPVAAAAFLLGYSLGAIPAGHGAIYAGAAVLLCGSIFAAVHHAEILAARVGEPLGSIILAVSVTVIEVGLILALMRSDPHGGPTIARDTVYSAVMLVLTGLIGLCLLLGAKRHFEQTIRIQGTSSYLAVLGTLAVFALILPNYTVTTVGPTYSRAQLSAVAAVSFLLYAAFLFVQTVRHRDYFLAAADDDEAVAGPAGALPSNATVLASSLLLITALCGVVLLAKLLSSLLNALVAMAALPAEFTGLVVAGLVLAPESIAAVRASLANRPQTSINLALGSALASIALTIPIITLYAAFSGTTIVLGVSPAKTVLLALALFISAITLLPGRTSVLQGAVHFGIFIVFVVLAAVP
jgi:Ca2+:H+ antiporter